tara:strand:- start:2613 stop:3074 length:462 start_codon:yes stop_codon:yes gene_type:complete
MILNKCHPVFICKKRRKNNRLNRRGTIVLIPMVCLILSLAVIGELLKQSSIEIKQLKKEQQYLQASWLADAAAQRAVGKLSHQENYAGETWVLPPEEIGGRFPGEVIIEIMRDKQNDKSITIRTQASYPAKVTERVRIVREWPFKLSQTSSRN